MKYFMEYKTILKLLNSSIREDNIIGMTLLANLPNPRAFIKKYGILVGDNKDARYAIEKSPKTFGVKSFYYKVKEGYYLLGDHALYAVCECYEPYDPTIEIINHEY